jgi:hypothetical protein
MTVDSANKAVEGELVRIVGFADKQGVFQHVCETLRVVVQAEGIKGCHNVRKRTVVLEVHCLRHSRVCAVTALLDTMHYKCARSKRGD